MAVDDDDGVVDILVAVVVDDINNRKICFSMNSI